MKKIIVTTFVVSVILITLITGCQKDTTLIIQPAATTVTDTVSFSKSLIPIFTANCALSSCHASGGHAPDLTAAKAYNSLISGKFVDTKNPETSIIYERLTGKLTPAMPMGATTNPSNIEGLILAWMKQGAKNN